MNNQMLVMQLTWGLFLVMMQAKYPQYTQEGLSLIWEEYERDATEMPDDDIRVSVADVALTFNEESVFDFVEYKLNETQQHRYSPADLRNMDDSEFSKVKDEIKSFLGGKFVGFTDLDRVVFKR